MTLNVGLESKDLGSSAQLISCAARILLTNLSNDGKNHGVLRGDPFVEEAIELLGCRYEDGTNWGKEVSGNHITCMYNMMNRQ